MPANSCKGQTITSYLGSISHIFGGQKAEWQLLEVAESDIIEAATGHVSGDAECVFRKGRCIHAFIHNHSTHIHTAGHTDQNKCLALPQN